MAVNLVSLFLVSVLIILRFLETEAGEFCYRGYNYDVTYCSLGCCGPSFDQYCCANTVWKIVVGSLGGLLFICIIIAIICCCVKKKGHSGRVVRPVGRPVQTYTTTTTTGIYSTHPGQQQPPPYTGGMPPYSGAQPHPFMPPQPPPVYKPYDSNPPPMYTYTDPAYPPGMEPPKPAYPPVAMAPGLAAASSTPVYRPPPQSTGKPTPPLNSQPPAQGFINSGSGTSGSNPTASAPPP